MPRPGPRPYECVRRAWHSDRHQPIRGSLIQELFRIVNEVHSLATKKNKEWQEKLPIVVLKSEEIMYSKANSEAEYVDFNTLWDRANDAINTIIRRDESTETGELLQPCIEAALHLGCTPRRASRSQRNVTPRWYLNLEKPEIPPVSLSNFENKVQGNYAGNFSLIPQSSKLSAPNLMSPSKNLDVPVSSSCSVYPLYYGNQIHFGDPSSTSLSRKADKEDVMENHSSCGHDGSNVLSQVPSKHFSETPPENGCDLSLRLSPLEVSCLDIENRWPQLMEEAKGGACEVGIKASDIDESLQCDKNEEFCFFPKCNAHSHGVKWTHETQTPIADLSLRKRKSGVLSHPSEDKDRQFCWPLKIPFKQLNGRTNNVD